VNAAFAVLQSVLLLWPLTLWVASVGWVSTDAFRRCTPRAAAWAVAGAGLLPYVGALLYAVLRPEDRLARRERALTRQLLEEALEPAERCLDCRTPLQSDFRCCPGCGLRLREPCRHCGEPLRLGWNLCPYCLRPALATPLPLRAVA
jgi:Double zinc ribbon